MLLAIVIIPFLISLIAFNLKNSLLWLVPVSFVFVGGAFAWESYLLYLMDSQEVSFYLPLMRLGECFFDLAFRLDFNAIIIGSMVLIISFITLIYGMSFNPENEKSRLFGALSLSSAMMLLLVFADNLITLYLGWIGTSLAMFFIVGFQDNKNQNNNAAVKAFIINAIGDIFFLFALLMLFIETQSVEINYILDSLALLSPESLRVIAGVLLLSVIARIAVIGFHVWLPEAMVAPSVGSALICSSTMVGAGIYVLIKMFLLFEMSEPLLYLMTWLGLCSALYGAVLATVQTNIKRIIAYIIISQMGLMLMWLGLGYSMLVVLLLAAFGVYVALLLLSSGMVITAMSSESDINKMGGLKSFMPITNCLMTLALIVMNCLTFIVVLYVLGDLNLNFELAIIAMVVLFFTAGCSTRMMLRVFYGKPQNEEEIIARVNENYPFMIIAMLLLVGGGGALAWNFDYIFTFNQMKLTYWVVIAVIAIVLGVVSAIVSRKVPTIQSLKKIINDRRDFIELYNSLFVSPFYNLSKWLAIIVDRKILGNIEKYYIKWLLFICGMVILYVVMKSERI